MVLLPPKTNLGVVLIFSSNNERHRMGTAKFIGGYDGGRARQPLQSVKKCCREPRRSPSSRVAQCS